MVVREDEGRSKRVRLPIAMLGAWNASLSPRPALKSFTCSFWRLEEVFLGNLFSLLRPTGYLPQVFS